MLHAWRGGRSLTELGRAMPAWEQPYWAALERIVGPLGPVRGDLQAGVVASKVGNSLKGMFGAKGAEPESAWDHVPDFSGDLKPALKKAKRQAQARRMVRRAQILKEIREAEAADGAG